MGTPENYPDSGTPANLETIVIRWHEEETNMKTGKIVALALTGVMAVTSLFGCGASDKKASEASQASTTASTDSDKKVLRVGMECA